MKSYSFYILGICLSLLLMACKKEKVAPVASQQVCAIRSITTGMYEDTIITNFTYAENGQLLKEEKFNFSEVLQGFTNYEYDGDKKIKEELYWTNGGSEPPYLAATTQFEYDSSGNLIKSSTSGLWCVYVAYEYSDSLLIKESRFNCWLGANNIDSYIDYEYDDIGRKIKENHFQANGSFSHSYAYDYENGRLSKKHTFAGSEESVFEYEYDSNGNLTKDDGTTYTYDKFNRVKTVLIPGDDTFETLTYEYCE